MTRQLYAIVYILTGFCVGIVTVLLGVSHVGRETSKKSVSITGTLPNKIIASPAGGENDKIPFTLRKHEPTSRLSKESARPIMFQKKLGNRLRYASRGSRVLSIKEAVVRWNVSVLDGEYYPDRARYSGVKGTATIKCRYDRYGRLRDCRYIKESPRGYGFGIAAVRAARDHLIITPGSTNGRKTGGTVTKLVPFNMQ